MNLLRNIGFAVASLFALEFFFWAYTKFVRFIIDAMIHNLHGFVLVLIWILFGGLIFGFMQMIGNIFAMGYYFVCRIGTHGDFIFIWTIIMTIIAVIYSLVQTWPVYLSLGFVGVFAAIFITINIISLGISITNAVRLRIQEEDF